MSKTLGCLEEGTHKIKGNSSLHIYIADHCLPGFEAEAGGADHRGHGDIFGVMELFSNLMIEWLHGYLYMSELIELHSKRECIYICKYTSI